jgi:hypothetical protein
MSLVKSIERGINSATYNPEAEKALREERRQANEKKVEFRNNLGKIRDAKTDLIQKKQASPWYVKKIDSIVKDASEWLKNNPDATVDDINEYAVKTAFAVTDVTKANIVANALFTLPKVYKANGEALFKEKKINDKTKKEIDDFVTYLDSTNAKIDSFTADDLMNKVWPEVEDKVNSLKNVIDVNLKNPQANVKEAEKQEKKVQQIEKAEKDSFSAKRLVTETAKIAGQVVGSLFIVMLFLVSGMLTANDAIGRDPQYRILYFVYGGLGFPFMLIYYLYRWFFSSAPKIYRLLPLFTQEADTTLGRFLWFPFTYKEDQAAIDAKVKFMNEAAKLVGKEYVPPAEKLGQNLEKFVKGFQDLTLSPAASVSETTAKAVKGANSILQALEKLELPK